MARLPMDRLGGDPRDFGRSSDAAAVPMNPYTSPSLSKENMPTVNERRWIGFSALSAFMTCGLFTFIAYGFLAVYRDPLLRSVEILPHQFVAFSTGIAAAFAFCFATILWWRRKVRLACIVTAFACSAFVFFMATPYLP